MHGVILFSKREKLQAKFDIAHFVACENLPFTKYSKICELEAHHGVELGNTNNNENARKEMFHYIAESRRQELPEKDADAAFFPLLLDGSTVTVNIDNELMLIV